jgi:hypothetical protein
VIFIKEEAVAKSALLFAIALAFSAARADEPIAENTILKVYPVGDLVAVDAMNGATGGKTTRDEWASEYPETIKALDELQTIVETMCVLKPVAVRSYKPSLSLIVRHSQDGHDEIDRLLRTLGEDNDFSIRMECRLLYSEILAELIDTEHVEAEQNRLHSLLSKTHLTKSETEELVSLLPSRPEYNHTVMLKSGDRTPWGPAGRPCTAMGRVDHVKKTVDIRIDYLSDDYAEATPFGTYIFSLAEGESTLFHHYCDGGTVMWLITAEILTLQEPHPLVSRTGR